MREGEPQKDPFTQTEGEDLLLVAAHTGDEVSVFGGLLADCTEKGYSTRTVFLSSKTRQSTQEAMDTAEALGQKIRPSILNYQYLKLNVGFKDYERKIWNEKNVLTSLVREIRRTKPKVVVTHAAEPEDEDELNAYLSGLALQAVEKAAKKNFDSISAKQYGIHEVQKVYLHVPDGGQTDVLLDYGTKLKRFEERTAKEVADESLLAYSILRVYGKEAEKAGKYRLAFSSVGEDSGKNSLFENTDVTAGTDSSVIAVRRTPYEIASPMDAPENDKYFRQEGEEAEVVVENPKDGNWEYRSDNLSIQIERRAKEEIPLVYYVAHIRMRKVDAFRPGFGSFNEDGNRKIKPYLLVRRSKAILAITGDQCVNTEEMRKGTLMRNGRLYGKGRNQPTMVLTEDMRMEIYERMTPVQTIVDDGVQNSYGFGPVLVRDGKVSVEECNLHRVKNKNPRAGLGMIEAGHFVAIAVDGRQKDHSIGLTLEDFAALFEEEGCELAYNMDGGISEGMYFMGEAIHQHKHSGQTGGGRQREWADAVMFGYSELVPTEFDPVYNQGSLDTKIDPAKE